jgi:hypothetical protein
MSEPLIVDAIVIEEDKILAVGSYQELIKKFTDLEYIDLKGKTLMPSFIDSHSHITMTASMMDAVDLSECTSFKDIVNTLKEGLKNLNNDFLLGFGYDHNVLEEYAHPTKDILDQVSKEIPIFIIHVSAHMGCASSLALEMAKINEAKEISGGKIGNIEGTSIPNGYLEENAMFSLYGLINSKLNIDMKKNIMEAEKLYASYGITTVQDGASSKKDMMLLNEMAKENKLNLDIVSYATMDEDNIKYVNEFKEENEHFKIGGYKLILDGSPQGKSAWVTIPYEGTDYCGYPWMEDSEVVRRIKIALKEHRQILAHTNGDAASDQYIRCFKEAYKEYPYDVRPVMIHCQLARHDQLDSMVSLKMIPSIFIGHTYYWGDVHLRNFGKTRGNHISPAGYACKLGLNVTFHQDTPVTKPNMFHSIWCAVNRLTRSGVVIGEEEKIDVLDALKAVTINAAYQYHEENIKGSLEVNKKADFIIVDSNPLNIEKEKLKDIKVLKTYKNGKLIYEN